MKITTKNYFATIKKIGFENLPLPLKQSHTVIITKTVNGEDWAKYKSDKDFKRMVELSFSKLGEYLKINELGLSGIREEIKEDTKFIASALASKGLLFFIKKGYSHNELMSLNQPFKTENVSGYIKDGFVILNKISGRSTYHKFTLFDLYDLLVKFKDMPSGFIIPKEKKMKQMDNNDYSKIIKEVYFIDKFLQFHDKIIYKNTFGIFIDELQKAIEDKKITKKSPVAKEIMEIQQAVLDAFNSMRNAKHFVLKPTTIKHLKSIIEKYDNAYDDIDEEYVKVKKKPMSLNGINQLPLAIQTQYPITKPSPINIMKSTDFVNLKFNTLGFKEKWLAFIGDPSAGFTAMVYGMPKMGKSYLCVDFAGYLARNHGKVLYVAKEEKLDKTLQDKLKDKNVAHDNLTVADAIPTDLSPYNFVFLDSVNKLKLTAEDLEKLKANNKGISFIYIFQATKGGQFKGNNEFQHDVDVVIEIPELGKAVQFGRFNQGGELTIFE
jgi:hypothetical protein